MSKAQKYTDTQDNDNRKLVVSLSCQLSTVSSTRIPCAVVLQEAGTTRMERYHLGHNMAHGRKEESTASFDSNGLGSDVGTLTESCFLWSRRLTAKHQGQTWHDTVRRALHKPS